MSIMGTIDEEIFLNTINEVEDSTYLTHNFHTYIAKFIPQIPRYFIRHLARPTDVVFDPFCGSGTTLVEALMAGCTAYGNDINPIATLISRAKTTPITNTQVSVIQSLQKQIRQISKAMMGSTGILRYVPHAPIAPIEDITSSYDLPNIDHWFDHKILNAFLHIRQLIEKQHDPVIRDFLATAVSSVVVKFSRQDSEVRCVAVDRKVGVHEVFEGLYAKIHEMLDRIVHFKSALPHPPRGQIFQSDTRTFTALLPSSVDLIITSPPYLNTIDYYMYHRLRMLILGMDANATRDQEIGSRLQFSSRKESPDVFIQDMSQCMSRMSDVLKPSKSAVIVIGDSVVNHAIIAAPNIVMQSIAHLPLVCTHHFTYNMDDTTSVFNKSFRTPGKQEHIMILQKSE